MADLVCYICEYKLLKESVYFVLEQVIGRRCIMNAPSQATPDHYIGNYISLHKRGEIQSSAQAKIMTRAPNGARKKKNNNYDYDSASQHKVILVLILGVLCNPENDGTQHDQRRLTDNRVTKVDFGHINIGDDILQNQNGDRPCQPTSHE